MRPNKIRREFPRTENEIQDEGEYGVSHTHKGNKKMCMHIDDLIIWKNSPAQRPALEAQIQLALYEAYEI